jgi:hypothetical protein
MPHESTEADHLSVLTEPIFLVIQQCLDGSHVHRAHARGLLLEQEGQGRKQRRFRLAPRGGCQDDRVRSVQDGGSRELLHRAELRPSKTRRDGMLQTRVQASEGRHDG